MLKNRIVSALFIATMSLAATTHAEEIYGLNSSHQIVKFNTDSPLVGLPSLVAEGFSAEGSITFGPGGLLYGIDQSSNVWSVNLSSGERKYVTSGMWSQGDIAFGPDGQLYGLTSSHTVQRYNLMTGVTTTIADGFYGLGDIRFGPEGTLYGLNSRHEIVKANPNLPLSGNIVVGQDFNVNGAFTFGDDDQIYALDLSANLYRLNPNTGQRTFIAFGPWGTGDLQFGPDGYLYGLSTSNYVQRIDIATGQIAPIALGFWGAGDLAFSQTSPVPEPESQKILILGLFTLLLLRSGLYRPKTTVGDNA